MRNLYKEFIELSEAEKDRICKSGVFVFDTNVLLNLYRYSQKTREAFFLSMQSLDGRVWMANHVAFEFLKNRCDVIYEIQEQYALVEKKADDFMNACKDLLRIKEQTKLESLKVQILTWIGVVKRDHSVIMDPANDSVLQQLFALFDSKTGDQYSEEDMKKLCEEGAKRYAAKIPPGYKDNKKATDNSDNNQYGDYIIWRQIVDYSKTNNKSIIFITDDTKEDWWQTVHGKKRGPRYELRAEFRKLTNNEFIMYSMDSFISLFGPKPSKDVVDEIKQIYNTTFVKFKKYDDALNEQYYISLKKRNGEILSTYTKEEIHSIVNDLLDRIADCENIVYSIENKYSENNMPSALEKQREDAKHNLADLRKKLEIYLKILKLFED